MHDRFHPDELADQRNATLTGFRLVEDNPQRKYRDARDDECHSGALVNGLGALLVALAFIGVWFLPSLIDSIGDAAAMPPYCVYYPTECHAAAAEVAR